MSHFKIDWISKYINNEPNVIFDIGTYNGNQAKIFKDNFHNSRVIAIEADKSLFEKIVLNKKMNNIEIYNYAICDVDGEILFHHNNGQKKGSGSIKEPSKAIFKFEGMSFSDGILIPSKRLETLCKELNIENIDIIHMDVQSAEYEVLVGLGKLRPQMIFLEVSALNFYKNTNKVDNLLTELSYSKIDISDITKGDELWILK